MIFSGLKALTFPMQSGPRFKPPREQAS